MLDRKKFSEGMALLCEVYQREANDILLRAYYSALESLSDAEFESACMNLLKTKGFNKLPLPSEILESINGKPEDQAQMAMAKVEAAMRDVSGYRTVVFDDPLIHAAINCFNNGWIGICNMEVDEWKWARKDFIKIYEAMSRNRPHNIPASLVGRYDQSNDTTGHRTKFAEIAYIGNKEKCLDWTNRLQIENSNKKLIEGEMSNAYTDA